MNLFIGHYFFESRTIHPFAKSRRTQCELFLLCVPLNSQTEISLFLLFSLESVFSTFSASVRWALAGGAWARDVRPRQGAPAPAPYKASAQFWGFTFILLGNIALAREQSLGMVVNQDHGLTVKIVWRCFCQLITYMLVILSSLSFISSWTKIQLWEKHELNWKMILGNKCHQMRYNSCICMLFRFQ